MSEYQRIEYLDALSIDSAYRSVKAHRILIVLCPLSVQILRTGKHISMYINGRIYAFLFFVHALVIFGCAHITVPAPAATVKPVADIVVEDSIINLPVSLTLNSFSDVVNRMLPSDKESDRDRSDNKDASVKRIQRFLNRQMAKIDDNIVQSDFIRERESMAWDALQHPIPLADNLSLLLNPQAVHVSTPSAQHEQGDVFTVIIGLVARPKIIANNALHPSVSAVPRLSSAPAGRGFHIALESELPYDIVSSELAKRLVGRVFTRDGSTIKIGNLRVYGSGESAVLQVRVTGTMNGTIYMRGTPAYDDTSRRMYIRDLDYTVETKHVLVKAGDWLFHTRLREILEDEAKWYVGDRIDELSSLLIKALNRKLTQHVAVSGTIDSIRPAAVGLTDSALRTILVVDGAAELNVF